MKNFSEKRFPEGSRATLLALVILAFAVGYWIRGGGPQAQPPLALNRPVEDDAALKTTKSSLYVCSMMCIPPRENPGECPICGMDLIAVSGGDAGRDEGPPRLKLSPEAIKLSEIQVARVERKLVSAEIRAFGRIEYDPAHISYVTASMPGVIDRIYVKRAGATARWGEPLFDIYSPDLYQTEQELVEAMKFVPSFYTFHAARPYTARDTPVQLRKPPKTAREESPEVKTARQKVAAVRHKLHILGLTKKDIDEFMKRGEPRGIATVTAPRTGYVIEQNAFQGTYVNTGTPIFTIADPRYIWVRLDVYESDFAWVRLGQEAEFRTEAYPGETFKGKVVFIDPLFDSKTRTFKVGVICPDKKMRFKPEMIVRAVIFAEFPAYGRFSRAPTSGENTPLVIPASAPLITGKRAVVYIAVPGEKGVYEGREVVLGPRAKDHYIVREGLDEGDLVVVNGNFKIDSAVQILAKPSMMNTTENRANSMRDDKDG
ncbi:MAG: efflux RND transporter periplasmic adaptor subunit [Deltaproteobacteria bacterium]|nr:efflux RND transporter periplasmic adaptor subunit [Deltaproteobacteria bacterium]